MKSEQKLISAIKECASILEQTGKEFWAKKLRAASNVDPPPVREILSWFGGMGSLTDVVVWTEFPKLVHSDEERQINAKINELQDLIYEEATELAREAEKRDRDARKQDIEGR